MKIIIPCRIFYVWTRLEIVLELKLSGHTDTLTKASNLIDELYKRSEVQSEQRYGTSLDNLKSSNELEI